MKGYVSKAESDLCDFSSKTTMTSNQVSLKALENLIFCVQNDYQESKT